MTIWSVTSQCDRFLNALKMLNNDDDRFKLTLREFLSSLITTQDIDEYLRNKKSDYNDLIAGLVKRHHIEIDDVYKEFDDVWDKIPSKAKSEFLLKRSRNKITNFIISSARLSTNVVAVEYFHSAKQKWNTYKIEIYKRLSNCVEETLRKGGTHA